MLLAFVPVFVLMFVFDLTNTAYWPNMPRLGQVDLVS